LPRFSRLLWLAASLWGVYAIRAHHVLALPVFVDESLHILRAQVVFGFSDAVASFLPGKLLLYYYLGLFAPDNQSGLWVSRQAVALIAPLNAALCYALVYTFTRSFRAGIAVVWLYATSPLMIFFERMALADTFALSFALGVICTTVLMARRPSQLRRIAAGFLLGWALLAKLTALPLLLVPALTMHFWGKVSPRVLWVTYAAALLIVLVPVGYSVYQEVSPPKNKAEIVEASLFQPEDRSRPAQITYNAERFAEGLIGFGASIPLLMAVSLLAIRSQPRTAFFLLMTVALAWGFLVMVTAFPTTRYLTLTFPVFLILCGVALHKFEAKPFLFYGLTTVLLGLSLFSANAWHNPMQLSLSDGDEWEYFRNRSSGYGLRDAFQDILQMNDAPLIIGFVGNCHSLRLYGSNTRDYLFCPLFHFDDNPALATSEVWLEQFRAHGEAYALVEAREDATFAEYDFDTELLNTYTRPYDGDSLRLYRITP
jgi:hypothetical protein